jgi:two-component system response regulator HydG
VSRILLVDDEPRFCQATGELLRRHGHDVTTVNGVQPAKDVLAKDPPDLVLLDLMLPDGNGLELLEQLGQDHPAKVVIITGHPAVKSRIRDLTGPSVSYLTKPIDSRDIERLVRDLGAGAGGSDEQDEETGDGPQRHYGVMVGESEGMQRVYRAIDRFGQTNATVLVQGASGTGKELVAEALHRVSGRTGQFVPVNCGALTSELAASELFGHEKGSFTGATRRHTGVFERAEKGTLFLDEITEMRSDLQAFLLRALETGRIVRVGGEAETPVDVRLIAATNRDPRKAVEEGSLREDLYYRLHEFVISLPPLRERGADIPLLVNHLVAVLNRQYGTQKKPSAELLRRCQVYSWPGNVRELKHVIHRNFLLSDDSEGEIAAHEPFENTLDGDDVRDGLQAGRPIRDVERELILKTLEHFAGDKNLAANTLGISLKTLYNRLHEYESDSDVAVD